MSMANIKRRDFERILKEDDFKLFRTKGDHYIYKNKEGQTFAIPCHKDIKGAIFINYCRTFNKKGRKRK